MCLVLWSDGFRGMAQPVFYDPRRARWKRLRTLFDIAGIVVGTVIIVFIYTALRSEPALTRITQRLKSASRFKFGSGNVTLLLRRTRCGKL